MPRVLSRQAFLRRIDGSQLIRLFDLLPDVSFFLKDRASRFVALNRRGWEFCGVKSEREALGKTDHDFFPRSRADEYRRDDQAVLRGGEAVINRVESAPEGEGSARLVLTSKIPLMDESGKVIGLAGFSRLTDQVKEQPESIARFAKVLAHIHGHPGNPGSTPSLARLCGQSVSQFDRNFRKTFGTSVQRYVMRIRIEAACRRLAESDETVASIAIDLGFHDHAHFTRRFRETMGISPSAHRRNHQRPGVD